MARYYGLEEMNPPTAYNGGRTAYAVRPETRHACRVLCWIMLFNPAVQSDSSHLQKLHGEFQWPATGSNSGKNDKLNESVTWPIDCEAFDCSKYNGVNQHVAPGALLAIPASLAASVKTTTAAGRKLKQAFVDCEHPRTLLLCDAADSIWAHDTL